MLFSLNPYADGFLPNAKHWKSSNTIASSSFYRFNGASGLKSGSCLRSSDTPPTKSHLHHCCRLNWHANEHWLHRRPVCRRVFPNGTLEINAHGFTSCAVRCKRAVSPTLPFSTKTRNGGWVLLPSRRPKMTVIYFSAVRIFSLFFFTTHKTVEKKITMVCGGREETRPRNVTVFPPATRGYANAKDVATLR